MGKNNIIYDPTLSVKELARLNSCNEDAIRFYIKKNKINRRLEGQLLIVNKIKKYLKKNPNASKESTAKGTNISICTIRKYWKIAKGEEEIKVDTEGEKQVFIEEITKDNVIKSIGDNQDKILSDILKLYVRSKKYDCDLTYSKGLFYRDIKPPVHKFDKYPLSDDVRPLQDAFSLADDSFNSIVIDLPFIIKANEKDAANTRHVDRFQCFFSVQELKDTNKEMLSLAYRLLKPNGILVQKIQNAIFAGKQVWTSFICQQYAQEIGFELLDEFVLQGRSRLLYYPDGEQVHARKYHSYFFVFRKPKPNKKEAANGVLMRLGI